MKVSMATAVLLSFFAGLEEPSRGVLAQTPDRESHGEFNGDIKSVLYVSEVEVSAQFFEEVLGFTFLNLTNLKNGEPYYAEFEAGGRKFGLHEPLDAEQEGRVGRQRIYFRVNDLEAYRKRVQAWGVEPGGVIETDWMNFFIVRDPDSHEVAFAVTDPKVHGIAPW